MIFMERFNIYAVKIIGTEFTDNVKIYILAEKTMIEEIEKSFTEVTNGKAIMSTDLEGVYFKEGNRLYESFDE